MNDEQIREVTNRLNELKLEIAEVEAMINDLNSCSSEISKKYLQAAIMKHASKISYVAQTTQREV